MHLYILYTGGTIGMRRSRQGYIPEPGLLTTHMQAMPEFNHPQMPKYTLHEYQPLIDSANMQPSDWQKIVADIKENYDRYDGFIILHGTDTMAYTASTLSFFLENLAKPVILTGSQVPLMEAHTDARENLINAMLLAAHSLIPEVGIFFNNTLFRGNRCQKKNSFSFEAFDSPNAPPLAQVGITIRVFDEHILARPTLPLSVPAQQAITIAQYPIFPGMSLDVLAAILENKPEALVLDTYGLGNIPTVNKQLLTLLEKAVTQGTLVINHTQCYVGNVQMGDYATSGILKQLGVVSAHDMTKEAIIGKLFYLAAKNLSPQDYKSLFETNLRGEISTAPSNSLN